MRKIILLRLRDLIITGLLLYSTALAQPQAVLINQKPLPLAVPIANTVTIPTDKMIILNNFNGIIASGPVNYQVIVDGKSNYAVLQGNPEAVNSVKYHIDSNGNIHFTASHCTNRSLLITLHAARLNRIIQTGSGNMLVNYLSPQVLQIEKSGIGNLFIKGTVQLVRFNDSGTGSISINQIRTSQLWMNVSGAGKIKLTGVVNIARLNFSGSGSLQMYWVNSGSLIVSTQGSGSVALAGVAKVVNAYAYDTSHLDLRYLRANTIFVKSFQNASVDVWSQSNLFALARNTSNIYYYNEPGHKSRMMQESGSVLPMGDIPGAIVNFNTRGSIRN